MAKHTHSPQSLSMDRGGPQLTPHHDSLCSNCCLAFICCPCSSLHSFGNIICAQFCCGI